MRSRREHGMTILEVMIVLAILALLLVLGVSGLRRVGKADLVDDTLEVATIIRRTGQLALETGQLHRVVFDFEKKVYAVEVCQGATTVVRSKRPGKELTEEEVKARLEQAQQRLATTAGGRAATESQNQEDAAKVAAALAGHHVLDKVCGPAEEPPAPTLYNDDRRIAKDMPVRALRGEVKFREIWVQHLEESTTAGQVVLHFFPTGAAEKAIIELSDSNNNTFSIVVHGLTGRVQVKDEAVRNPEDHMLRNAVGEKEAER